MYIHTHIHAYTHTHIQTYTHTAPPQAGARRKAKQGRFVCIYVCVCVRAYMRSDPQTPTLCRPAFSCAYRHTRTCTHKHTHLLTHTPCVIMYSFICTLGWGGESQGGFKSSLGQRTLRMLPKKTCTPSKHQRIDLSFLPITQAMSALLHTAPYDSSIHLIEVDPPLDSSIHLIEVSTYRSRSVCWLPQGFCKGVHNQLRVSLLQA